MIRCGGVLMIQGGIECISFRRRVFGRMNLLSFRVPIRPEDVTEGGK